MKNSNNKNFGNPLYYLENFKICTTMAGSHAYGTNIEGSDIDHRGIFIAGPEIVSTPFFPLGEIGVAGEDTKYYELNKFMDLCVKCNPNIMEILWVRQNDVLESSPAYEILRHNREEFLSKKVVHTYTGYGYAQMKRFSSKFNRQLNEKELAKQWKHAMHLVRLLRMGKEILQEGKVKVWRPDAKELLDIRDGKWSYEQLLEFAETTNREILELKETSNLRNKPDIKFAAKLLLEIRESYTFNYEY